MSDKNTICVISCGKIKIWDKFPKMGPVKAKQAYIGLFFRKCRAYAEKFYFGNWYILSAKYGLISPEEKIENYNLSFKNKKDTCISLEILKNQFYSIDDGKSTIVCPMGKMYTNILEELGAESRLDLPLKDCSGIGYMLQKLNELIKE